LNSKLSDKDKKDWQNFILNKEPIKNKDLKIFDDTINKEAFKKIDLHGFSLDNANKVIEELITKCFEKKISKILVITGKGLRSKNTIDPYVSKDLSILRYSVPDFIKSNNNLMKKIKILKEVKIEDGGNGAFYVYLKKPKE